MRAINLGFLLAAIGVMSCSSQKSLESDPPFTVARPVVEYWAGGREPGGSGMRFEARWNPRDPSAITVDSLFFRGRVMKAEVVDSETGFLLKASYTDSPLEKPDYIMHADSLREVGNQPPAPLPALREFPFELQADEAVVSYTDHTDGKKHYARIGGVVEKSPRIYPGRTKH